MSKYGKEWRKKDSPFICAVQQYYWVNRVLILDESIGRRVIEDITFDEFKKRLNDYYEVR